MSFDATPSAPLTPASPLWAWAFDAITHRVHSMLEHTLGVREGEDIEAVHDMRVWSRRLVAAMRVFHVCYPGRPYERLLREAKQVTRALGAVRDLDVLIDHYEKLRTDVEGPQALAADYLMAVLRFRRKKARGPMLKGLDRLAESEYARRLERYLEAETDAYRVGLDADSTAGRTEWRSSDEEQEQPSGVRGGDPFYHAAAHLLEERYHELYAFEPYVAQPEAVEELHEMRIAAKWLRYTMELFAPAYPDELKANLAVVKKFQELLGDLHDSDVRLDLLAETLAEPLEVRGLEALHLLLPDSVLTGLRALRAREKRERAACYGGFRREWEKQERKGFRGGCLAHIRRAAETKNGGGTK